MVKRKPVKDTDADSAAWWPKWRAAIKADLQKDEALRDAVIARVGRSCAMGGFTLEAFHRDFPMPLAVIWFGFVGLNAIQINNIYTLEPMRRCGLMTFLQRTMLAWYPGRRLITGAGTKSGRAWMLANGWKKTGAGWEHRGK